MIFDAFFVNHFVLLTFSAFLAEAVRIIDFKVSDAVRNGTSYVILDCDFVFERSEQQIVMKW